MRIEHGFKRAIVVGGSIAGCLSARVLSDYFDQVLLLDRDPLPAGPEERKGTPQARHAHALLEGGREVLESLFPGMMEELHAAGGEWIDTGWDAAWYQGGMWQARRVSGIRAVLCTRLLLEWRVRQRVGALRNVTLRSGCSVEGLLTDDTRGRVTGVRVKAAGEEERLEADLVVDASGRGSRAPLWLEALGHGRPEEEKVGIDLGYASRLYEPPTGFNRSWKMLAVFPRAPEEWKTGFILSVEGGRWLVSLNGHFGDHPPTGEDDFLEFSRSLPTRDIHEALQRAKPLTAPVGHKVPSSRWLHYERMPVFPEGLIILGDAVCSLNPTYGQGMSLVSLSARLLGECLAEHVRASPGGVRGLSRRFQRRLARMLLAPWLMVTALDLKYPQAQGRRFPGLGVLQWGFDTLGALASMDTAAGRQCQQFMQMRQGAGALLRPGLLKALAFHGLKSFLVAPPAPVRPADH